MQGRVAMLERVLQVGGRHHMAGANAYVAAKKALEHAIAEDSGTVRRTTQSLESIEEVPPATAIFANTTSTGVSEDYGPDSRIDFRS